MKINITKVIAKDTKKDGTKLIGKNGKPYFLVGIQTKEHAEKWINGFTQHAPTDWEGKEMELDIYEEEYQGKKQLKFKFPDKNKKVEELLSQILTKLGNINAKVDKLLNEQGIQS